MDRPPHWLSSVPIAHRGLHGDGTPGNTVQAFERAVDHGYAVELDVVVSRDGVPFVSHDYTFVTSSGKRAWIWLATARDIGKGTSFTSGAAISTLSEVLDVVAGAVPAYVDIKPAPGARRVSRIVADTLSGYKGPHAILSFDPRVLRWFKQRRTGVIRGQSAGAFHDVPRTEWLQFPAYAMPFNFWTRPDFIAFDLRLLPSRVVTAWTRRLPATLIAWGVRTEREAGKARGLGANIMFDDIRP